MTRGGEPTETADLFIVSSLRPGCRLPGVAPLGISVPMMSGVERDRVLHLYDDGVDAFAAAAGDLSADDWDRVACGEWTATHLARHVLAVAGGTTTG